jgi:hypothetical protein
MDTFLSCVPVLVVTKYYRYNLLHTLKYSQEQENIPVPTIKTFANLVNAYKQSCGSGSVGSRCFGASRIRIRIR